MSAQSESESMTENMTEKSARTSTNRTLSACGGLNGAH
jgi:hypothetical protein